MKPSILEIRAAAEKDSHHAIHLLPKTVIEMCDQIEYLDKLCSDAISTNERQAMMIGEQEKVIERLRTKLEVTKKTSYDGIDCRDETIRLQDEEIDTLKRICDESYQVIGVLADDAGRFDEPAVIHAMDNASTQTLMHENVLPFPVKLLRCLK